MRAVSLPVGEKGVVQQVRHCQKKKNKELFFGFAEDFDETQNGEKIKRGIEE